MAEKKTGDPKDGPPHVGGARFVPVTMARGTAAVVPGPMTPGPPKPEPEERWTLAPGHRAKPAPDADDAPAEPTPVEPVRATVSRPAGDESESESEPA